MSRKGSGHVACFPDRPFTPRDKTPVLWEQGHFTDAEGIEYPAEDAASFIALAKLHRWDVHVASLRVFPWLDDWLGSEKIDKLGKPPNITALSVHAGRNRIKIVESKIWQQKVPNVEYLRALMEVSATCGTSESTPVALGLANMRRLWSGKVDSRPNVWARESLWQHAIGARCDGESGEQVYRNVNVIDMTDAYATMCEEPMPSGSATHISWDVHREPMGIVWWFCECDIYVPFGIERSPIIARSPEGVNYEVKEHGVHRVWITSEEAEECEKLGMRVVIVDGWGWWRLESHLSEWSAFQKHARQSLSPMAGKMLKAATVSAIGAHFTKAESWKFSTEGTGQPVIVGGNFTRYSWTEERNGDKPALTHLWVCVLSRCRLAQFRKMQEEEAAGNVVVSSDTDEVVLAEPPKTPLGNYRSKGTLREYVIPARRWAWKDGKIKAPGLPESERSAYDDLTAEEFALLVAMRGKRAKKKDWELTDAFNRGWKEAV